jgi:hypothetical protein
MRIETKQTTVDGARYLDVFVTAHDDEAQNRDLYPEALEVVEWCKEAFGEPDAIYPYGDTEDLPTARWAFREFNVPYKVQKLDWTGKALLTAY